ncbi:MAG: phosphoribosyltransferase [Piscirickettsiaceae bacterium]|nr:MAG: phosphoribosyltransferase [Piscirickettsiaceae bacterium]
MNNWLNKIQSILYPYTCFLCNQPGNNQLDLCDTCHSGFSSLSICCDICGIAMKTKESHVCGRCLASPPHYDKITTLFEYQDDIKQLVLSLKFNAKVSAARTIGKLMASHFSNHHNMPDALLPVPLHKKRLRERGFNQSELIAEHLHQQLNIPLLQQFCIRTRNTINQTSLKAAERRQNLKNAFHCKNPQTIKSIAVIDDVVTTGSTANEIARTLKKAGVKHVEIWAFARA